MFKDERNVSGEATKSGFPVVGWESEPAAFDAFAQQVEQIVALPNVRVRGLMTMAPIVEHAGQARPFFASLRALRDALRQRFPAVAWDHLSMGMTDDFEAAIAEGATLVRIGRAQRLVGGPTEDKHPAQPHARGELACLPIGERGHWLLEHTPQSMAAGVACSRSTWRPWPVRRSR